MKKKVKVYIWRDADDFDGEFLSLVKPKELRKGTYYVPSGNDIFDLRGNPLGIKRGEIVECYITPQ